MSDKGRARLWLVLVKDWKAEQTEAELRASSKAVEELHTSQQL